MFAVVRAGLYLLLPTDHLYVLFRVELVYFLLFLNLYVHLSIFEPNISGLEYFILERKYDIWCLYI